MRRSSIRSFSRGVPFLALVIASSLLLAATPWPSDAPGPASPEPPPSQLPVPVGPLFPPPSLDPLDRPSGSGAGVEPPPAIVGAWYSGSVSSIGYVDPGLGSYSSGGSHGELYAFAPDGTWHYGWLLTSRLYACAMRVMVYRSGVIARSDPAAGVLELDTTTAQIHSEDSCVDDGNYERDLPSDDETLYWSRSTDAYGEVLLLRGPETSWGLYRPLEADPAG